MIENGGKISVIVPAFNAEASIRQCVRSLQQQDHSNLEIIVVDDQSPDRTSEIVRSMAALDGRVKVFRPEMNLGVHGARRFGFLRSSGGLIGFLDADDYAEPRMYSTLLQRMVDTQASVGICSAFLVSEGKKLGLRVTIKRRGVVDGDRVLSEFCSHKLGSGVLWNKLYSREVIEDAALRELERAVDASEDYVVNFGAFARAKSVALCPEPLYNYVVHKTNASGQAGWPVFARLFRAYVVCLENYAKEDPSFARLIDVLFLKQLHHPAYRLNDSAPAPDVVQHIAASLRRMADVNPTSVHSILQSLPFWYARLDRVLNRSRPKKR